MHSYATNIVEKLTEAIDSKPVITRSSKFSTNNGDTDIQIPCLDENITEKP